MSEHTATPQAKQPRTLDRVIDDADINYRWKATLRAIAAAADKDDGRAPGFSLIFRTSQWSDPATVKKHLTALCQHGIVVKFTGQFETYQINRPMLERVSIDPETVRA